MLRAYFKPAILLVLLFSADSVLSQKYSRHDKKTESRIRRHINYLASDALEGRITGSPGQDSAANYIVSEFKKAGLKAKGDNGTWFQEFSIVRLRIAGAQNKLVIGSKELKVFKDFFPLSYCPDKGEAAADLFDAGKGISAPELGHDDYTNAAAAKGKIFLIDMASPDPQNPHSKFASYNDLKLKIETARKNGAAAVLFVNSDKSSPDPDGLLSTRIKPGSIPVFFLKDLTVKEILGQMGTKAVLKADILTVEATGKNVLGYRDNKAKTTVVIGAHYDHLGFGELGGSRTKENGLIHNGADDNASGTAALIELAAKLKKPKRKFKKNNYLFIAFSGEELGLIGSKKFVENPTIPLSSINYMINMDMVGRLDSVKRVLMINGAGTSPEWKNAMGKLDFDSLVIKTSESGVGASDHTSFYLNNIPAVHLFTGQHSDYHLPGDDIEKINFKGEVYVINYIACMVKAMNKKGKLPFVKTKDDEDAKMSFKVTMGIMPDYVYSDDGVRVDGVTDGKPAANAGIQKGDIILQMGDMHIHTMTDYMKALNSFKKGDTVKVRISRNGESKELNVTF